MKAALNGVLNCSILDGWWAEAYSPDVRLRDRGPAGEDADEAEQDEADAEALYAVLEEQVLPAYYERDERRPAAELDRAHAGVDRRAGAALRHRTDGDGVRRAALPAGARRRCEGREPHRVARARRRACTEARLLPLPASGGRGRRASHPLGRAEQDEEARPERPDREAEDQADQPIGPTRRTIATSPLKRRPPARQDRASARRRSQPPRAAGSPRARHRRRRCRSRDGTPRGRRPDVALVDPPATSTAAMSIPEAAAIAAPTSASPGSWLAGPVGLGQPRPEAGRRR